MPGGRLAAWQCPDGAPPPCAAARPARPGAAALSVAVLYFDNLSRDTADAYLADGLTEQTIAQLGEVSRLTVASRFAVRRFRGEAAQQSPAVIGRTLNVAYLVTGSVQRAGTRLRVGVELLRAGSGVRVWGEQYDRTETDLLRLQDDIASAVATGIVGRLLPSDQAGITRRSTRDAAAFDQFLRGNFYLAQRTPASILLAIRAFDAAVATDPTFTDALARVAYAYGIALDNEYDIGLPRDSMVARGVATAQRAVQLDSLSSDAWLARAYLRMAAYPRTFEGARELFEKALVLNPRSAEAHHQFASYLMYMGDTTRARTENERALALEPGRAITWFQLANLALLRREPRAAIRLADSALAADPTFALAHVHRISAALALGDTAMVRQSIRGLSAVPQFVPVATFFEYVVAVRPGDSTSARALAAFLAGLPVTSTSPGNQIASAYGAQAYVRAGDRAAALAILEAASPRGSRLHDMMRMPEFDPVRTEPRFVALFNETRAPGSAW